jgi:hypothetical protein
MFTTINSVLFLLFSGPPTIKDCNHLKMDHYFSPFPSLGSIGNWRSLSTNHTPAAQHLFICPGNDLFSEKIKRDI